MQNTSRELNDHSKPSTERHQGRTHLDKRQLSRKKNSFH